jgi:protocatechuate 3,4-dioxygenase beta subunit
VWHRGRELTSQLYVAGHPSNARDFLFSRLTVAEQAAVSMVFVAGADGPEATIDLSL